MKLTVAILLAACIQVSAKTNAQQVSLSEQNSSLEKVFKEIKRQTGYQFFYNSGLLKKANKVNIELTDVPLTAALDKIFAAQPLDYKIVDKIIAVREKDEPVKEAENNNPVILPIGIKGKVTDEDGNPLKSVSVQNKNTKEGTTTDADGNFSLDASEGDILEFSSVGYKKQQRKVAANQASLTISMEVEVSEMNNMVVIGYGTAKRKDLTGSVSSVKVGEIKNTPLVTIDQAMAGKAAGVQVTQADGSPGGVARIRIRGGTSLLGGNDPLYIIDGVQVPISNQYIGAGAEITNPIESIGGSSRDASRGQTVGSSFARGLNTLAGLNIDDIESIDILKDASATAIYGSRAANGVVIITTKKGRKNEKPTLEANYYYGISKAVTEKVLNADQYKQVYLKGSKNLNDRLAQKGLPADPAASAYLADPSLLGTANVNWIDLVTHTGQTHNADISVRGGGTGSSYYMSLGYNTNDGTLEGTKFERIAGKINLNNEFNSRLRLNTNLDYGFTKNSITNGLYGAALLAPPTWAPYNPDGSISTFPNAVFPGSGSTASGIVNPMALLMGKNNADGILLLGSLALEYDILKDLRFRSVASINYSGSHQVTFEPSTTPVINNNLGAVPGSTGVGSESQLQNRNTFFENTLTWDKNFDANNRLTVLGGTSWQRTSSYNFAANGQTYPDNTYLTGLSSAAVFLRPTAGQSYSSLLSFYTRVNYAYKEKYLVTLTGRADASSKFPQNNRVGYFPSFGVAWRMKEESFLKDVSWISELKLRASAGYTGTQNIGDNMFYTLYTPAAYAGANALIPSQLGNDEIKWENTLQKDLGLDLSLFKGRLNSSVGFYEKTTNGLLMAYSVPLSSGFSTAIINKADIRNRGWEVEVRGDIIQNKKFGWTMGLNVAGNKSLVTKVNRLLPNGTSIGYDDPVLSGESIGNYALVPGQPVGQMYGAVFLGLLKTQAEVNSYIYSPTNPNGSIWVLFPPSSSALGIGYPRFQTYGDVYGTKALAPMLYNRAPIGSSAPKFYGGMTHTFSYKSFSVIANFTYSYGGDILYLYESNTYGLADLRNHGTRMLLPTYQEDPSSTRPVLILKEANTATGAGASNLNVFGASYLKLKSINISYAFPQSMIKKLGLKQGLFYVAGSNLFTITKYPGPDPEVSNDPYSIIGGNTDDGSYPQARQYTIGVRFSF